MSISAIEIEISLAADVIVTEDTLSVDLADGRTIAVPLGWYPRLEAATLKSGAGALFRLVSEAHRIRLAHLFDPVPAAHTSVGPAAPPD